MPVFHLKMTCLKGAHNYLPEHSLGSAPIFLNKACEIHVSSVVQFIVLLTCQIPSFQDAVTTP